MTLLRRFRLAIVQVGVEARVVVHFHLAVGFMPFLAGIDVQKKLLEGG